ncbi:MAG: glycosyltransferase [Candidatus Hydrogenedentes bacterium]|nr:glycosyltransferase [Candidatus Hydrogenedentota bacterium]
MSGSAPKISIVMRSKNSDWVIGHALAGLYSQEFTDFELIVVDSGSTDRTLDIVRAYPHRLIQIEAASYFPGAVLNMAIEHAQSDLIVFQNSDAVPLTPYTLGTLVAAFDDPKVQAAFVRQLPRPDSFSWVLRDYASAFPDSPVPPPWMKMSLVMSAMRKSIWQRRPFYTDAWASEDTEWSVWAQKNNVKVKYVHDSLVMHSHNYTNRQIYGRRFVEGEADAFIYGGHSTLPGMLYRLVRSVAGDWVRQLAVGDFRDMPFVPARRWVYHWAHHLGHRHGEGRIARGDRDASVGQKTVLARHDQ